MKKFMMIAATAIFALAANAQNPDAVKQVKGAKSYSEANEILKAQAASMTNQERALSYDKLVGLALDEYTKAEEKAVKAQLGGDADEEAKQRGKSLKSAYNALKAARECDKADREPNDKGQVKIKYRKANQGRVLSARNALINGGLDAFNAKNYADAQKYFGAFVDSRVDEFYAGYDFSQETNFPDLAYYAGLASYLNQDYKKANKYADVSLAQKKEDANLFNDNITLKLGAYEGMVKNAEIDTLKLISNLKKLYKEYPENEMVFAKLVGTYQDAGDNANADKVLKDRIAANPNDAMALAYLGQNAQNDGKYDEAITAYEKALAAKPDFIQAKSNLAICYLNRGAATYEAKADNNGRVAADVKTQILSDFNKAKSLLEEIKNEDPDEEKVRWKYALERVENAINNIQ